MKQYLITALMLLGGTLWAQNKTTYRVHEDYTLIVVEEGWDAVLKQTADYHTLQERRIFGDEDNLDYIVVCSDKEVPASKVFGLKDGILRLKKNTALPQGTKVEIHTAQRIERIDLKSNAALTTSRIEGYGDLTIAQWDHSRFVADTLSSASVLLGFKGDSCYFYCNVIEADQLLADQDHGHCYGKTPVQKDSANQTKTTGYSGQASRLMPVWDEAPSVKFGHDRFSLHLGLGARLLGNGTDNDVFTYTNTAYFENRGNIAFSIYGKWRMSRRWDLKTGLQLDWYYTPLYSTDDDLFGDSLNTGWSGPAPTIIRRYGSHFFLGLPLSVTYHPILRKPEALGLNAAIVPSVQLSGMYYVRTNDSGAAGCSGGHFNPFRIEARFGVETNVLGIIHGLQFFYNFLPVYVGVPDQGKYKEFGIAVAF